MIRPILRAVPSILRTHVVRVQHAPVRSSSYRIAAVVSSCRWQPQFRSYSAAPKTMTVDEWMEELQEQYATTKDEFEIAVEETEKKTIYAADDRAAAQEELKKLKDMFKEATSTLDPEPGEQVKLRVGQRIREIDQAIQGLEELAKHD